MLYQFVGCRRGKKKRGEAIGQVHEEIDWEEDHVAFAVGELGLRLHEFYDMPWCEYLIKCMAYERMQKDKWKHTRFIAYHTLIGNVDPKKMPTLENFMNPGLDIPKSRATEEQKAKMKADLEKYYNNLINKK